MTQVKQGDTDKKRIKEKSEGEKTPPPMKKKKG